MTLRQSVRFPLSRGFIAAPVRAWGEDFAVMVGSATPTFQVLGAFAVVDITGPMMQRANWCFESYDRLRERVAAALLAPTTAVCLRFDSAPGGDFQGSLECAREIRAMVDAAGKRLVAFTDSCALSAAYAIACAADEIVVTESAMVGSIGVWAPLADLTAADRMAGANIVIVASGTRKADRNPHVAITDASIAGLQGQVDIMAEMFFALVAGSRSLGRDAIASLQGAEVLGAQAVGVGLADRVVANWNEFINSSANAAGDQMGMKEARAAYMQALSELTEKGDEDAKKALAAMKEEGAKSEAPPPSEKKEEPKKEAAKAASDEVPPEKPEKKDEEAKAAATSTAAAVFALTRQVHALQAERAAEKETSERTSLLAKRPDFSTEVRASLAGAPISFVRDAVATWPRASLATGKAAATAVPGGTRGDTQVNGAETHILADADSAHIDRKMGFAAANTGVTRRGRELELGYMTPAEAQKALADLKKGA